MNLQQIRILRETVRRNFNLTEAAQALATSQSGLSRHIKDLEYELGVEIFVRHGKRFLGLTEAGREILVHAERILTDADNIRRVASQLRSADQGVLVVATTHTQARYALQPAVAAFRREFPRVKLTLHQTSPTGILNMLLEGRADIGVSTEKVADHPDVAAFPYYRWRHAVIAPRGHELEGTRRLTLAELARWPIITYHEGFTGRGMIDRVFAEAGERPEIVMEALDADVIKDYVALGVGVGIVASMAVKQPDERLAALDGGHLFDESTAHIAIRRGRYMRGFAYRFLEICRPELREDAVRTEMAPALATAEIV